jgi:hypothetical protein
METLKYTEGIVHLSMESYERGGVDVLESTIQAFIQMAILMKRDSFTITEIRDCLEACKRKVIEVNHNDK